MPAHLSTFLELSRASNLPTIWSNVLVGASVGAAAAGLPASTLPIGSCALLAASISLLYSAGIALNDLLDLPSDRLERPSRPIPSGRVSPRAAGVFACACSVLGIVGAAGVGGAPGGAAAIALVCLIVAYDLLHARLAASVLLLGLCRASVYLLTALAVQPDVQRSPQLLVQPLPLLFAAALGAYTILLSLAARQESDRRFAVHRASVRSGCGAGEPSDRVGDGAEAHRPVGIVPAALMPLCAVAPLLLIRPAVATPAVLAGGLLLIWLALSARNLLMPRPRLSVAVMGWLAGICLLDAYFLTLLDQSRAAAVAVGCFAVTVFAHRRILGT